MPAGPIGSVWADDSWLDTAWEAGSWADAQDADIPPEFTRVRAARILGSAIATVSAQRSHGRSGAVHGASLRGVKVEP